MLLLGFSQAPEKEIILHLLASPHWLPVRLRIKVDLLFGVAPSYISNVLHPYLASKSADRTLVTVPHSRFILRRDVNSLSLPSQSNLSFLFFKLDLKLAFI